MPGLKNGKSEEQIDTMREMIPFMVFYPLSRSIWFSKYLMNYLTKMLSQFGERYPGCWQAVDKIRTQRENYPPFPSYCFFPIGGAAYIMAGGVRPPFEKYADMVPDMTRFVTFAAWRVTQRIYRFDEVLFEELWETPVDDIPPDAGCSVIFGS
jgi:hypothetical protein